VLQDQKDVCHSLNVYRRSHTPPCWGECVNSFYSF